MNSKWLVWYIGTSIVEMIQNKTIIRDKKQIISQVNNICMPEPYSQTKIQQILKLYVQITNDTSYSIERNFQMISRSNIQTAVNRFIFEKKNNQYYFVFRCNMNSNKLLVQSIESRKIQQLEIEQEEYEVNYNIPQASLEDLEKHYKEVINGEQKYRLGIMLIKLYRKFFRNGISSNDSQ